MRIGGDLLQRAFEGKRKNFGVKSPSRSPRLDTLRRFGGDDYP